MILVYGASGYIGSHIIKELKANNTEYVVSPTRIYLYNDIIQDIIKYKPTHIISAAGYSTPTTIDHYENNKEDLILTNTTGNLILSDITHRYNIHLTLIMSGCIYKYTNNYEYINKYSSFYTEIQKFTEECKPNFSESFYSKNRIDTENILSNYSHICILRLRMPISSDVHKKSLITKIINYKTVINIPNSMTVLDDLIPFINIVIDKKLTGKYNMVNTGTITHPIILSLYQKYVNPYYKFTIISEDGQNLNLLAKRSNCHLSNKKISDHMNVPHIFDSVKEIFIDLSNVIKKYHLY